MRHRYFIKLAFNGTPFKGWQIQPNGLTVQEEIETKLSIILRSKIAVTGCGRTDSGVHARVFYAHFECDQVLDLALLKFKLNCMLSHAVSIYCIYPVDGAMHARFSAVSRTYQYHINQLKDVFNDHQSWYMHAPLDMGKMNMACEYLLGKQDFTSFSKLHTQTRTNICTIVEAFWSIKGGDLCFTIKANRFLHNMVRAIVGTCIGVGRGVIEPIEFKEIIESKCRQNAGASAPGHGLFLVNITYP